MPALALAIAASVAAGVWAQRRYGDRAQAFTRKLLDALLYGALPFITFFVLARAELSSSAGVGLLLAYAMLAIVGLLAYGLATRVLAWTRWPLPPSSSRSSWPTPAFSGCR